ncbi:Homoserine O-succinyltransferase [Mesorhizobium metallidurans STM 2683]|uniref:Homoserine O-acetyltransferase n=1 Tax=Mesorhizobium metallidurans STM 2683 TaxID=1297569 RepID=M5EZ21_9HYPH|nr:homoserine O-succinyltransferase [Mesorhizobium metallidurans]CCV09422.1 Homoserine O-succinyltransferase [Mesorhizobium metallidurans STM 2683]
MSLILDKEHPVHSLLKSEGVRLHSEKEHSAEWMSPLSIGLVNLMPKKVETETQLARLLGSSPFPVQLELIRLDGHKVKTTSSAYFERFYQPFGSVRHRNFDGLIITGAPVEHMSFEDVSYWSELCGLMTWAKTNVLATMGICWGAMALAYYHHGIPKYELSEKAFGCYRHHKLSKSSPYLYGLSDDIVVPVSRWTEIRQRDIDGNPNLKTLLVGATGGPAIVEDATNGSLLIFNHLEYDWDTLKEEYERDTRAGTAIKAPTNYFPLDNPNLTPANTWRSNAQLLFWNWMGEMVRRKPVFNHWQAGVLQRAI